jgi:hypothetical protein
MAWESRGVKRVARSPLLYHTDYPRLGDKAGFVCEVTAWEGTGGLGHVAAGQRLEFPLLLCLT